MNVRDIQSFLVILFILIFLKNYPVNAQMPQCNLVNQTQSISALGWEFCCNCHNNE